MKNRIYFWFGGAVIIVIVAIWLFKRPASLVSNPPSPVAAVTNSTAARPIVETNPAFVDTPKTNGSNEFAAVAKAYQEGKITAEEIMNGEMLKKNNQCQDFYGKIIDQYGEPVVGTSVTGNLFNETGFYKPEKRNVYKTQSNASGLFQFTGLYGSDLNVIVKKDGYIIGARGEG